MNLIEPQGRLAERGNIRFRAANMAEFTGFDPDHFAFFRELERHNNREWFLENRARYDAVVATFRALLGRLEEPMLRLNRHFDVAGKVNGNFSRINRDIRFQRDRAPYNTNYYLFFYDRRRGRKNDGRFYAAVSDEGFTTGFSIYDSGEGAVRNVLRPRLARHYETLRHWLAGHVAGRRGYDCYWYRRVRKGGRQSWEHGTGLPRTAADWETMGGLVVRKFIRPVHPALGRAAIAHEIELTFERLYPLYAFTSMEGPGWRKHLAMGPPSRTPRGRRASPRV